MNNQLSNSEIEELLRNKEINFDTEIKKYYENKVVLGFDVYQYSQFELIPQTLIPFLLRKLIDESIENCFAYEGFIFQKTSSTEIRDRFIDTGDGGFFVFDNPLEAVIFAIFLQMNLKQFNNNNSFLEEYGKIIKNVFVRFSITYDELCSVKLCSAKPNYYGPAIIRNARILAKDSLNRFLFDEKTMKWFEKNFNGLENLILFDINTYVENVPFFNNYEKKRNKHDMLSLILNESIYSCDVSKIGKIKSKKEPLDLYSVHFQVLLGLSEESGKSLKRIIATLGNLNASGLNIE
jgi:hypothetical protein